jgi:citrate synthase
MSTRYLSAHEAANELDISLPTLYAYVSRGLIRSEETGGSKRTRRYHAEDVERIKQRKQQRRDPQAGVETALHWGAPLLESAITLIADGQLYYRGQDAVALATSSTLEQVAALIWTGNPANTRALFADVPPPVASDVEAVRAQLSHFTPFEQMSVLLPLAAATDLAAYDLQPAAVAQTGARILHLLTTFITGAPVADDGIVRALQQQWAANDPNVQRLLNAALILCADHELNVSSFTARCVASAGATPYAVVQAGLAALGGVRHGGQTERAEEFFDEARTPDGVRSTVARRLKRGEPLPGFGHTLFPDGDPRGATLLRLVAEAYPTSPAWALAQATVEQVHAIVGKHPNIDLALATLARTLDLPPGAALALFALGRAIGWIGHAIEQYGTNQLIRPRARYIGKQPEP